jgi:hypothetical protein
MTRQNIMHSKEEIEKLLEEFHKWVQEDPNIPSNLGKILILHLHD